MTLSLCTALEGVFLLEKGISPYEGDTFHEQPIFLFFYKYLLTFSEQTVTWFFILMDVVTAIMLSISSFSHLLDMFESEQKRINRLKVSDCREVIINPDTMTGIACLVGSLYLLSPYSILSCVAHSTSVVHNFLMAMSILSANCNLRVIAVAVTSVLVYQCLHASLLLPAIILMIETQRSPTRNPDFSCRGVWCSILLSATLFAVFMTTLMKLSLHIMGDSTDFLTSTFVFQLTVPDLTPNIGIFWYFFTEMFEHFRLFFLFTFQMNSFMYAIPLAVTLRRNPCVLLLVQLILLSLLKPYPSVSDLSLYLSMIPTFKHVMKWTKQGLVVGCTIVTCSAVAPIMWHLWIMLGTANSNFFFGVTLAYNVAQILLATDILFACKKRDFYLEHGIPKDENGKVRRLELVTED